MDCKSKKTPKYNTDALKAGREMLKKALSQRTEITGVNFEESALRRNRDGEPMDKLYISVNHPGNSQKICNFVTSRVQVFDQSVRNSSIEFTVAQSAYLYQQDTLPARLRHNKLKLIEFLVLLLTVPTLFILFIL